MSPLAARFPMRSLLRAGLPLLLIGLIGAGCGMIPPEPKTEGAKSVFTLYNIVFAMGVAVFVGVEGFILYSVFRYRRRDDRLPPQTHGNTLVEIIWTAIPTVIVFILFVLSITTLVQLEPTTNASTGGVDIEVDGFQWQWQFIYQDGDSDPKNNVSVIGDQAHPPTMVVPVGEPVRLTLVSKDVIHSFYVPQFLIKRDLIPVPEGQDVNHLEFTVSDIGTYAGQCAEFCGDFHAKMTFSVQAMSRADFDKWLADTKAGKTPPPSAEPGGQTLELTAANLAFDKTELQAPANKKFSLKFTNTEGIPHNVVIVDKDNNQLFKTDDLTGPGASGTFSVPALAPGEYTFFCSFHPAQMVGKLTVQ